MVQTPVHRKAGLDRTETACRDRPVPYREDNMKVLIWVGVFLGVSLVQALLRNLMYAGMLPMIPGPLIFYGIASFLAYRLCDRWEYNHSKGKYAPKPQKDEKGEETGAQEPSDPHGGTRDA